MRIPPLEVLLTWPAPNYENPQTRGNASLIVNVVFVSLVLLAVGLRFYCRMTAGTTMRFGWDDIMIALALFFTLCMTTVVILADRVFGWNRHIWDVEAKSVTNSNIIAFIAKLVFTLASTFTRLSLCCFYYRLVRDSGITWFKWTMHGTVAFSVVLCVVFVLLTTFLCTPVQFYWEYPPRIEGYCMPEGKVTLAAGILNTCADVLTTTVPIPLVMRLRLPLMQRIGVCLLFCGGFVIIVAGVVRTYFTWRGLMDTYDETWYAYPLWIAAAVEIDLGVICACAPALKSLTHSSRTRPTHPRPSYSIPRQRPAVDAEKLPDLSVSTKPSQSCTKSCTTANLSRSNPDRQETEADESWVGIYKVSTEVHEQPLSDYSDDSEGPVLFMSHARQRSMELENFVRTVPIIRRQ